MTENRDVDSALNCSLIPPRRLGSALQANRHLYGLTVETLAAASNNQFTATNLLDIEAGRCMLSDAEFQAVVSLYQMENRPIFPPRVRLIIDADYTSISAGAASMPLTMTARDHILERYVGLLYVLREQPAGTELKLRTSDIEVLTEALDVSSTIIRNEIVAIMVGDTVIDATASLTERFLVPTVGVLVGVAAIGAIVMVPAGQANAQATAAPESRPIPQFVESDAVGRSALVPALNFTETDGAAAFWTNVVGSSTPSALLGVKDDSGSTGTGTGDPDIMTDVAVDEGDVYDGGSAGSGDSPTMTDVIVDDEEDGSGGSGAGDPGIEDYGEGLVPNDGGAGSGTVGDVGTGIEDSDEVLVPNDGGAGSGTIGDVGTGIEDSDEVLVPNDGGTGTGEVGVEMDPPTEKAMTLSDFYLAGGATAAPVAPSQTPTRQFSFAAADDDATDDLPSGTDVTADSIEVLDGNEILDETNAPDSVSVLSLSGGDDQGPESTPDSETSA